MAEDTAGTKAEDDALAAALAAEHAAVWAYAVVAAQVEPERVQEALADLAAHRTRRDQLETQLRGASAVPVPSEASYDVPTTSAAALAARVESGLAAAYAHVLTAEQPGPVVATAAQGLRDAAVRGSRWSGATTPFPGLPGR